MKITHLMTATAALALMGGAALAQTAEPATEPATEAPATEAMPSPEAATPSPMESTTPSPDSTGPTVGVPAATSSAMDAAASTPATTPSGAPLTVNMVTNGPVPDTPENRAMYAPLSRAGKATKAAGN
ncbi:MAG: hypothetical protein IT546_06550 [Caulobacteraceae bacterium]|nr:hypothetical protein [Caulobacteraceae bacterium]